MARVLEGAQLRQDDAVPKMNVRAGRVHAELDPQPLARGELLGKPTGGQDVDCASLEAGQDIVVLRHFDGVFAHKPNARLVAGSRGPS